MRAPVIGMIEQEGERHLEGDVDLVAVHSEDEAGLDEGDDAVPSVVADHAAAVGAAAVAISSRIEAELSELDDDDAVS